MNNSNKKTYYSNVAAFTFREILTLPTSLLVKSSLKINSKSYFGVSLSKVIIF